MFENSTIILLAIFSLFFLVTTYAVNAVYQRKAGRLADEMLAGNNDEYNRQIRANAVILLVRRSLWALFVLWVMTWNFRAFLEAGLSWLIIGILLGIGCFAFGVFGFKSELKRLKTME